ncbi:MAG: hypothetical protein ISS45_03150 [Candidatus Omnitrophica bacterium]|nr:hypothetical protein [Candidatus Omnitrophota bacterium]
MLKISAPYICPNVDIYQKFEDLLKSRKDIRYSRFLKKEGIRSKEDIFELMYKAQKSLILAEPGYGKTRLLQEFQEYPMKLGKQAVFIDLKLFAREKKLEIFIIEQAKLQGIFLSALNSDIVLCFDALDEVKQDAFYELVRQVKLLFEAHKDIKVIFSCRLLFYKKYPVFEEDNFTYMSIDDFDFEQVRAYLGEILTEGNKKLFSDTDIDTIIQDFKEPNWESIILIPRYLEKFVEFRKAHPSEKPTRSSLYDFFINERLEIEDSKRGAQDRVIIRRVLEKIALVMEIYQKNEISKDELLTIMEDIQSQMAGNFLDMGKLQILFEHSLWKDYGNTISYEDHTIQEYLASCELLRLGWQKHLYEFVVDPLVNEIHPSWFGTLSFCVDQDLNLLEPLIDFGQRSVDKVIESEEYHRFLTKVDVSRLSSEQKIRIFKKVFDQYQKERIWIEWDIARRLGLFFEASLNDYLKEWMKKGEARKASEMDKNILRGNVAHILGFIIGKDLLNRDIETYWKKKLIEFVNDDNLNGVLQRHALFALESFKDKAVIEKVQKAFKHSSDAVRDAFIDFCSEVEPNEKISIDYFIEGVKQNSIYANRALTKINTKDSLRYLLEKLNAADMQFLKSIIHHESIYLKDKENIFKNIDENYEEGMQSLLIEIVFKAVDLHRYSSLLVKRTAEVLRKHKQDIILDICDVILGNDKYKRYLFEFVFLFSITLTKGTIGKVLKKLKDIQYVGNSVFRALYSAKEKRAEEGNEVYEEGRKYLADIYKQSEEEIAKGAQVPSEAEQTCKEFLFRLEPEKGKYRHDVFQYFTEKYDLLKDNLKGDNLLRFKKLTTDILKKVNPQEANFKVLQWDKDNKSIVQFQINTSLTLFEDCLNVVQLLNITIDKDIRRNMINFIPFAQHEGLNCILKLIPDIKGSELTYVLKVYSSDNEKKYFHPYNFVKIVCDNKLVAGAPVLKAFVADKKLQNYDRREALKCLGEIEPNLKYFESVFKGNIKEKNILADIANQILIEKFQQQKAIRWKIGEIKKRCFKFVEPKGGHTVSDAENELHEKRFAQPLIKLSSRDFMDEYISLLDFSLRLIKKDMEYWSYAQYIWEIIIGYVRNLKLVKSQDPYSPIKKLEEFIQKNSTKEGINWFGKRLKELKREYQLYIGVPKTIVDCIKIYNSVKSKQYLEIVSVNDLRDKIKGILDKDIRLWIEVKGAKDLLYDSRKRPVNEVKIQKIVYAQLAAELEKAGITIIREPQKLDDERVDLYISYGFSPHITVVIEIKKSDHSDLGPKMDLSKKDSYRKLKRYIQGFSADYGIFLVFNINKVSSAWGTLVKNIEKYYTKINNVEVIGIDAFNS